MAAELGRTAATVDFAGGRETALPPVRAAAAGAATAGASVAANAEDEGAALSDGDGSAAIPAVPVGVGLETAALAVGGASTADAGDA